MNGYGAESATGGNLYGDRRCAGYTSGATHQSLDLSNLYRTDDYHRDLRARLCIAGTTDGELRVMKDSVTTSQQRTLPHSRCCSVVALPCLSSTEAQPLAPPGLQIAHLPYRKRDLVAESGRVLNKARSLPSPICLQGQVQIPIVSQYSYHRTTIPAVSSLRDCPTPAR